MHYIDNNTDLTGDINLYLNTRVDSTSLVDLELYSENSNKIVNLVTSIKN